MSRRTFNSSQPSAALREGINFGSDCRSTARFEDFGNWEEGKEDEEGGHERQVHFLAQCGRMYDVLNGGT